MYFFLSWKPIIKYINMQYEAYLRDEQALNRRHIVDNRVHCCLYFISPTGHGYGIVIIYRGGLSWMMSSL